MLELKIEERTEDLQILIFKLNVEIEERKKAEQEIIKSLEKEKELSELKSRFVSMVSHEFRTPLTIIRTSAQLIEKYYDKINEEDRISYMKRIMQTVDLMTDLIDNVLFIGRSDAQKLTFNTGQININDFCRNIIREIQLSYNNERSINATFDCQQEMIALDSQLLTVILFNLLTNAIKYSEKSTTVDFDLKSDEDNLTFSIIDRGIGMNEEDQRKIFDSFHRGSNVGNIPGTGLGMSVVLRSLELHGGRIELSSKLNEGSKFTVTIPLTRNKLSL